MKLVLKAKSKQASAELISILIAILLFASLSGVVANKLIGNKDGGIKGSAKEINNVLINNVP
ncbi:MAG: hypothetical protein RR460_06940 [Clostridium sp.]